MWWDNQDEERDAKCTASCDEGVCCSTSSGSVKEEGHRLNECAGCCKSKEILHEYASEMKSLKDQYAYLSADFTTYRRRAAGELQQAIQRSNMRLLKEVVGIYDDVVRAGNALHDQMSLHSSAQDNLKVAHEGIMLVRKNCEKLLEQYGVRPISQLKVFDPTLHEALLHVPATEEYPADTIVEVLEPGYMYEEVLLRPARVSVAR